MILTITLLLQVTEYPTKSSLDFVAHAFIPSTWEEERGRSLWALNKCHLHTDFQVRQGYTVRPCLQKNFKKQFKQRFICKFHIVRSLKVGKHRVNPLTQTLIFSASLSTLQIPEYWSGSIYEGKMST